MTGLVVRNTGSWYDVATDDGQLYACKVKGNFRLRGIRSTNPVAVGDRVELRPGADAGGPRGELPTALITEIHDRRNYIVRRASNLSKQSHIIAANIDLACLVATVAHPETSTTFIDRFLATAEAYRVPVLLLFNKIDLYDDDERRYLDAVMALYAHIGYDTLAVSAQTGQGFDELRRHLRGLTTLFSGNSGVGKSTILNRLIPSANAKVAAISAAHDQGQHTTTFSEMFVMPDDDAPAASAPAPPPPTTAVQPPTSAPLPPAPLPLPAAPSPAAPPPSTALPSVVLGAAVPRPSSPAPSRIIDTPGIRGFGTYDFEREEVAHYFREIFATGRDCRFDNCTHTHEPGCAVLRAIDEQLIAPSRYASYLSMLTDKDEDRYRHKDF